MSQPVGETAILLVEDNEAHIELALYAFRKHDLAVRVARDGEEALQFLCDEAESLPSLVLLDLDLPGIDGLEVLRRIKADWRTRSVPVIVLTASEDDQDRMESFRLGASSYIVKPVDLDKFIKATRVYDRYWRSIPAEDNGSAPS
jgi:two-component system, response regulator